MNRGEACIAGAHAIVADRFHVRQKLQDQVGGEVLDPERRDGPVSDIAGEAQQQLEGIAVRRGGVRADIALRREMANEEVGHERREIGARHDGLRSVMRYPKRAAWRRVTSPTKS